MSDLRHRLLEAGTVGLDGSPGDPLATEALGEIDRLEEVAELVDACLEPERNESPSTARWRAFIDRAVIKVNLPELVDAIEDVKYVLEGTHVVLGVNSAPIAAAVHAANMAKRPVYYPAMMGGKSAIPCPVEKPTKPVGWAPPDVRGLLIEQGCKP